jgi:hypothetical protein
MGQLWPERQGIQSQLTLKTIKVRHHITCAEFLHLLTCKHY